MGDIVYIKLSDELKRKIKRLSGMLKISEETLIKKSLEICLYEYIDYQIDLMRSKKEKLNRLNRNLFAGRKYSDVFRNYYQTVCVNH